MRDAGLESRSPDDQIDRICDDFESQLKRGLKPDVNSLLDQVSPDLRELLLVELIMVGLEYTGTSPFPESAPSGSSVTSHSTDGGRHLHTLAGAGTTSAEQEAEPTTIPERIGGYELIEELGRGGMGIVFRARQLSVDRIVALKIIRGSRFYTGDDGRRAMLIERFRREARAASKLDLENIATVYDVGEFEDAPYYAMRLVEGKSLHGLLNTGPLTPERAVRYLLPIARAIGKLNAAHVIHRDIKPSNILIETSSNTPVLTDFGLAKLIDVQHDVTLSDEGIGSPPYMAPEQVLNATTVTAAADIYSLGATLYHLLTGRPPFTANAAAEIARQIVYCDPIEPRHINSAIPRDLETICLKCLEKDEDRRYLSAEALADDLQRFLDHRPILARPIGRAGRLVRWARRNPAWVTLAVSVTTILAVSAMILGAMQLRNKVTTLIANSALEDNQRNTSNELFARSGFSADDNPHKSFPFITASLETDRGTPRESITRLRIRSLLEHGANLRHLFRHEGLVLSAEFSPSGDLLATGSADRKVRIWSTTTGDCKATLEHEAALRLVSFNHRGDLLATGSDDGSVQLWSAADGRRVGNPLHHPGYVTAAIFSPDDKLLITAAAGNVRVYRLNSLQSAPWELDGPNAGANVSCLAVGSEPLQLACGRENGSVGVWRVAEQGLTARFDLPHSSAATGVQFSLDGARIVTTCSDHLARVWDAGTGQRIHEYSHPTQVREARFMPDSKHLLTAATDGARIWPLDRTDAEPLHIAEPEVRHAVADPSGGAVLTIGSDQTARLWNSANGTSLGLPMFHAAKITGASFSPDGQLIVTYSADGTARLWDRRLRSERRRLLEAESLQSTAAEGTDWSVLWSTAGAACVLGPGQADVTDGNTLDFGEPISAACVSRDGARGAVITVGGKVIVRDRASGGIELQWPAAENAPTAICFTTLEQPGLEQLAIGDAAGNVIVRDVRSGETLRSEALPQAIRTLIYNDKLKLLLAADAQAARLIRLDQAGPVAAPLVPGGEFRGACFSANGRFVALYGSLNRVLLLNIGDGSPHTITTSAAVRHASFNETSSKLLTVADDGEARIWQTVDGAVVGAPLKSGGPLIHGAFDPLDKFVVLCSDDGTARVWHVESAQPVTAPLFHDAPIVHARFVHPDQLQTITERGVLHLVDLAPASLSAEMLAKISMAWTGYRLDASKTRVPLSRDELSRYIRELGKSK